MQYVYNSRMSERSDQINQEVIGQMKEVGRLKNEVLRRRAIHDVYHYGQLAFVSTSSMVIALSIAGNMDIKTVIPVSLLNFAGVTVAVLHDDYNSRRMREVNKSIEAILQEDNTSFTDTNG